MTPVKLFRNRRGERTFRRLVEGSGIDLFETVDDRIIISFNGQFSGDVVIDGDLTVNGTTTTINSTIHVIADNKIVLNDGEIGAGVVTLGTTAGITVDRGSETDVEWCWDESADMWTSFGTLLGGFADPISGTHVGDRDFNDVRYLQNVVEDTSPQLGGNLNVDIFGMTISGEVVLSFSSGGETGVNNIEVVNGIASFGPIIRSVGADTNVDLNLSSKGTGVIKLNGIKTNAFTDANESKLGGIEAFAKDDQDLWETVAGDSGSTVANNSTKTLTIAGTGLISTSMSGDILTISTTATADQTAADIRALGFFDISNDGTTSGLDADLLDGFHSTAFAPIAHVGAGGSAHADVIAAGASGFMTGADKTKLNGIEANADVTDATNVNAAGAVMETDYNAQTILIAVVDNTPLPVVVSASTFVGRKATGDVGTMTVVEARTLLNVESGAAADQNLWATFSSDAGTTTADTTTDTLTVAGGTGISTSIAGDTLTITTPALLNVVEDASPQLGGNLESDTFSITRNSNVVLSFASAGEFAINWIDVANSLTGVGPIVRAVGADTNIDLKLTPKGTGAVSVADATNYETNVTEDDDIPNKKFCDDTYAPLHDTINVQTGTAYTLVLTDDGKLVTMDNVSANTLTIPTNASVAFPIGTRIDVIMKGAGVTTVTGDTGVTVNGVSAGGATIDGQFKGVTIRKAATDTWFMVGAHGTVA